MKVQLVVRRQWRHHLQRSGFVHIGIVLLLSMLAFLLSGCSGLFQAPAQSGTPETGVNFSTPTSVTSPTATSTTVLSTITLQVVGCPSTTINWDRLVGTQANVNKVQKVICGGLEGAGSLEALVDVRYYADARLDFSVYDNLLGTPTRRLAVSGLLSGDAAISSASTVMTAEINPGDVIRGGTDIFKEYQWNGAAFVQVPYPAIYPDVTRYQAEHAQAMVSSEIAALQPGQPVAQIRDAWRTTAGGVVSHLVQNILHWVPGKFAVTLPSHAAQLNILPVVVTNLGPGGGGFVATLHHLNDVSTNIFEIYSVTSINGGSALNSPAVYTRLTSPVTVSGGAVASGGVLGQVVLYDDVYTNVGSSGSIHSSASSGYVSFTNAIHYSLGAHGVEEGVVAFYATSQNNANLSNQVVMMKVFLSD